MRVLEFHRRDGSTDRLQLHPVLTVLGIDEAQREMLHGLGHPSVALVLPTDLPAPDPDHRAAAIAAADETVGQLVDSRAELDAERCRLDERCTELLAEVARRSAACSSADALAEAARQAVEEAAARVAVAENEWTHSKRSQATTRELATSLAAHREDLERLLGNALQDGHVVGLDTVALERTVDQLSALATGATASAEATRAWALAARAGTAEPSQRASYLIAIETDLEHRAKTMVPPADDELTREAEQRGREIAALVTQLETIIRDGDLSEEARSEIEGAHDRVENDRRASRRTGSVDPATALAQALERYGFGSYLEYGIATSTGALHDYATRKLRVALNDLSKVQRVHAKARLDAEERWNTLQSDREAFESVLVAFLGHRPTGSAAPELKRFIAVPAEVQHFVDEVVAASGKAADEARAADARRLAADGACAAAVEASTAAVEHAAVTEAAAELAARELERVEQALAGVREEVAACADRLTTADAVLALEQARRDDLDTVTAVSADIDALVGALTDLVGAGGAADLGNLSTPAKGVSVVVLLDADSVFGAAGLIEALERVLITGSTHGVGGRRVVCVTADEAVLEWATALDNRRGWRVDLRGEGIRPRGRWWRPAHGARRAKASSSSSPGPADA